MTSDVARRPFAVAIVFIVSGFFGLWASFQLTLDKFTVLKNPDAALGCDFSILVQCGINLQSWQGSLLGFPNTLIGLVGFFAPVVVGVALLAGARFDRWFWILFNIGVTAALVFCIWLMSQSIFIFGVLCPWCMVAWAATILLFWTLSTHSLAEGVFGGGRRLGRILLRWVPLITLLTYIVIALIAQIRLDVISYIFP